MSLALAYVVASVAGGFAVSARVPLTPDGEQCYCGQALDNVASGVGATLATSACSVACAGDKTQMCGATDVMQLFELASPGAAGAASSAPASAASASGAATSAPASPAASGAGTAVTAAPAAPSSAATKYVWAHHMVGNTELYNAANWTADVTGAKAAGLDGFALNMGRDAYQPTNVQWAYDAAASAGSFSCFFSFDMTSFPCTTAADAVTIADLAKKYASHPAQAKYNGKILMSTFAGDACTFGQGNAEKGWAQVRTLIGTETYFVPSTFMTTAALQGAQWFDGQMHWDAAWPLGKDAPTTKADEDWITALAGRGYMAPVSPFFFTYYGKDTWDKNWIYRSDDWLLATRFEQVIGMRDRVDMIELLSWNGE